MSDDELVEISLKPELMPEAKLALEEEIARRGMSGIEERRLEVVREIKASSDAREVRVAHSLKVRKWQTRVMCTMGLLAAGYGIYLRSLATNPGDRNDGELLIMLGIASISLAFFSAWLGHLWRIKVLFR